MSLLYMYTSFIHFISFAERLEMLCLCKVLLIHAKQIRNCTMKKESSKCAFHKIWKLIFALNSNGAFGICKFDIYYLDLPVCIDIVDFSYFILNL